MGKLKVAIIGCGRIATSAHTPAYLDAYDLAEVKYYCDIIPERAKKLAGEYSAEIAKRYGDDVMPRRSRIITSCWARWTACRCARRTTAMRR